MIISFRTHLEIVVPFFNMSLKMGVIQLSLFSIVLLFAQTEAYSCDEGWEQYKDGGCIKYIEQLRTYQEAKDHCTENENATLVMVKDSELQLFLTATVNISENIWIGGRYDVETESFLWEDGTPVSYTDWEVGYPENSPDCGDCIELNPVHESLAIHVRGKMDNVNCSRKNFVICQRTLQWDLTNEVESVREDLQMANNLNRVTSDNLQKSRDELQVIKAELQETKQLLKPALEALKAATDLLRETQQDLKNSSLNNCEKTGSDLEKVIPVGFIYIEYYNQSEPRSLWPTFKWEDISSAYAGHFFRASGGGADTWGQTQTECAPRITRFDEESWDSDTKAPKPVNIPASGWSGYGRAGAYRQTGSAIRFEGMRFYTEGCEVRPINQAIRMWKRVA